MVSAKSKVSMTSFLALLAMLFSFASASPALAAPQGEVCGQGKVQLPANVPVTVSHISVNAWLDENGAHGQLTWVGGVTPDTVPRAYPWQMDVTSIEFAGNTAKVCWEVVHSVVSEDIGFSDCFDFTDNGATGAPDEIVGQPLESGNIIVR